MTKRTAETSSGSVRLPPRRGGHRHEMMVIHHEGAGEMAVPEQSDGQHNDAVDLAGTIVDSPSAEIAQMKTLLGS